MSTTTLLRDIAYSRAGDKGNRSTLSVIAYDIKHFPAIERAVTASRVKLHYTGIAKGEVERYAPPQLGALNFVLHDALGGGVTRISNTFAIRSVFTLGFSHFVAIGISNRLGSAKYPPT